MSVYVDDEIFIFYKVNLKVLFNYLGTNKFVMVKFGIPSGGIPLLLSIGTKPLFSLF